MNEKSRRYRRHGRLLDERTIQFERILPGPIEVVWDYLTKREHLATWLVENDIPPNPGERIALTQDSEHVPIRVSGEIHARITRARPPHLLAFT
ncbi:MAG: SRPBCC domain-containing protein, partial [Leptospirales bacterium]